MQQPTKRVSWEALIVGVAALLAAAAGPQAVQAAPAAAAQCGLQRYASLDVVLGKNAAGLLLPVSIGGKSRWLALDTRYSVMSADAAASLGLHSQPLPQTMGTILRTGVQLTRYVTTTHLAFGALPYGRLDFLVLPPGASVLDTRASEVFPGIDPASIIGSIAISAFAHADLELDLSHGKLALYSPMHCPGQVVYWAQDYATIAFQRDVFGGLYFPTELAGQQIETTLSVSQSDASLDTTAARALYGLAPGSPGVAEQLDAAGDKGYFVPEMTLRLAGVPAINARVQLVSGPPGCQLQSQPDGMGYGNCGAVHPFGLGLRVLEGLHLYISTDENKMYVTAADAQ